MLTVRIASEGSTMSEMSIRRREGRDDTDI